MKLIDRIIEKIEQSANEQYNEFAKKQLLFLVEEIKELKNNPEYFKDCHLGLYATDKPIPELLRLFFESKKESEWNLLYHNQQDQLEKEFNVWAETISWRIT